MIDVPHIPPWQPTSPSAELQTGLTALEQGDLAKAIQALSQCEERNTDPEASYRLGVAQSLNGATAEAIKTWKQTLRLDAMFAPALYDMAVAYTLQNDATSAAATFSRLLTFHPDHQLGRFNFGNLLYRMGRVDQAIAMYAPLTDSPNPPHGILVNLGRALRRAGRLEDADACYRRALLATPNDHFTQWNRSHVLCLLGRWQEGFAAWEHRLKATVRLPVTPTGDEWMGGPLPQSLLIIAEQGHGDAVQCLRYIPDILAQDCQPILALHPAVTPLAHQLLPGVQSVDFQAAETITADAWCPIFSLPHRLQRPDPASTCAPYLSPMFKDGLATFQPCSPSEPNGTPRIGVVWAGNPGHDNDHIRSMPFDTLTPLIAQRPDLHWQSLQVGASADMPDILKNLRIAPMPQVANFAETAKLIAELDLVICVDTAVAHVAATLGKPTWLMLAAEPDWRWGQTGTTTPWYPCARLFRQTALGDWSNVITEVTQALNAAWPPR